jgi:hypothetical protein
MVVPTLDLDLTVTLFSEAVLGLAGHESNSLDPSSVL